MPASRSNRPPGLLIAAEGLDGSGKSAGLDALGRWLERRGRRVHLVTWQPSRLVARAARAPRGRQSLTPRVAALLAASEAADRMTAEVRRPLARGDVVLADRYAWTACRARGRARARPGLGGRAVPVRAAAGPRPLPPPGAAGGAGAGAGQRPASVGAEAVAAAYGDFLARLLAAYDRLAAPSPRQVRGRPAP